MIVFLSQKLMIITCRINYPLFTFWKIAPEMISLPTSLPQLLNS